MTKKKKKVVRGYVYEDFMRAGWKENDGAVFVYRRRFKGEKHMLPICITFTSL